MSVWGIDVDMWWDSEICKTCLTEIIPSTDVSEKDSSCVGLTTTITTTITTNTTTIKPLLTQSKMPDHGSVNWVFLICFPAF